MNEKDRTVKIKMDVATGDEDGDFESLIDLSAIAAKAKERVNRK